MIYTTALDTYTTTDLTSFARNLLDDVDASTMRSTLGLGSIATQNSNNVTITGGTISLSDPVSSSQVATKNYVDSLVSGLAIKQPVRCATTVAGTLASSFVTDSIIDGIELVAGDRILIKNQTDQKENGIYVVKASGAPDRSSDADNTPDGEVAGGLFVFVLEGSTQANTGWVLTSPQGTADLGVDDLVFSQFSAFTYSADGNGILVTNRQFSLTYGSTANTVCEGDDSRLSDSRTCNNTFDNAVTARENLDLGDESAPTFESLSLVKAGTGVTTGLTIQSGLSGSASSSNVARVTFQTQNGSGSTVTHNLKQHYDGSNTVLSVDALGSDLFSIASNGLVKVGSLNGYVKGTSGALSASTTIPFSDITGAGSMASASTSDYLAKADNLSGLTDVATARGNLFLGSLAVLNTPSSGYVKSNGSTLSASTSIPLSDIQLNGGITVTGGSISLNHNSNNPVSIGTGTNNSTVTIGNTANDYTSIVGSEIGFAVPDDGTIHVGDTYWIGDSIANNVSVGNAHADSVVSIIPKTVIGSASSSLAKVKVTGQTDFQVQFGSSLGDGNAGGWLHSSAPSQALICGGGHYDGGWVATATTSSHIDMVSGNTSFYCDDGLTAGNSFTPTNVLTLSPDVVTANKYIDITTNDGSDSSLSAVSALKYNTSSASGTLYAVGSSEHKTARVLSGRINMNSGAVVSGTGFSTTLTTAGEVEIDYDTNFTTTASVTATPSFNNLTLGVLCSTPVTGNWTPSTGICIRTQNSGTGARVAHDGTNDIIVAFTAIGY